MDDQHDIFIGDDMEVYYRDKTVVHRYTLAQRMRMTRQAYHRFYKARLAALKAKPIPSDGFAQAVHNLSIAMTQFSLAFYPDQYGGGDGRR